MTSEQLRYLPSLAVLESPLITSDVCYLQRCHLSIDDIPNTRDRLKSRLTTWGEKKSLFCLLHGLVLLEGGSVTEDEAITASFVSPRKHSVVTCYTYDELAYGIEQETRGHVEQFHNDCLLGAGTMSTLLDGLYWKRTKDQRASFILPPDISNLALAKTVRDIPSPYLTEAQTIAAWEVWMRRQRAVRASEAYLIDGEWVGYYTFSQQFRDSSPDPPMTGIRFRTQGLMVGGGYIFVASGVDSVDEFDLRLSVAPDGYVVGRKTYRHQTTSWNWRLSSTPFGLYGVWTGPGNDRGDIGHLGGAVWLYKREWIKELLS
jgi:hypothetical protein